MENGLGRVGGENAIQPDVQLLKLCLFNALAVSLRRFGAEFPIEQT